MSVLERLLKTASEDDPESLQLLSKELLRRGYGNPEPPKFDPFKYSSSFIHGYSRNPKSKVVHFMEPNWSEKVEVLDRSSFCSGLSASHGEYLEEEMVDLSRVCRKCLQLLKMKVKSHAHQ